MLREALSWLSSQEPQLGMMIASCKRFDGWALGLYKVGEGSGERETKFGNVSVPPQPTPKDKFASKPNQPIEKPSEKVSETPSDKPSEKPCEDPHPKPKPRSICFHCEFLLTQNVNLAPNTQQAEQAGFTRAKNHKTCQSIFPEN
jgi:hypothetical protein